MMLLLPRPAKKSISRFSHDFPFSPVPLLFYITPNSLPLSSGSKGIIHYLILGPYKRIIRRENLSAEAEESPLLEAVTRKRLGTE
jgi:hypothetical protein